MIQRAKPSKVIIVLIPVILHLWWLSYRGGYALFISFLLFFVFFFLVYFWERTAVRLLFVNPLRSLPFLPYDKFIFGIHKHIHI